MKKIVIVATFIMVLFSTERVFAWGGWAHKLITYTAENHLDSDVKAKIEKYLGSSMVDHCTWMDKIRKPVRNKKHPEHEYHMPWAHTLGWHMIVASKDFVAVSGVVVAVTAKGNALVYSGNPAPFDSNTVIGLKV